MEHKFKYSLKGESKADRKSKSENENRKGIIKTILNKL